MYGNTGREGMGSCRWDRVFGTRKHTEGHGKGTGMLTRTLVALAFATAATAQPTVESAWVELGAEGKIIARAVTMQSRCPKIKIAGTGSRRMAVRAASTPPDYAVLSCEAVIPAGARSAAIAGQPLTLPKKEPRTIAVFGDTGCRLKGDAVQACNDPTAWP